jgi:hypothetical protein
MRMRKAISCKSPSLHSVSAFLWPHSLPLSLSVSDFIVNDLGDRDDDEDDEESVGEEGCNDYHVAHYESMTSTGSEDEDGEEEESESVFSEEEFDDEESEEESEEEMVFPERSSKKEKQARPTRGAGGRTGAKSSVSKGGDGYRITAPKKETKTKQSKKKSSLFHEKTIGREESDEDEMRLEEVVVDVEIDEVPRYGKVSHVESSDEDEAEGRKSKKNKKQKQQQSQVRGSQTKGRSKSLSSGKRVIIQDSSSEEEGL